MMPQQGQLCVHFFTPITEHAATVQANCFRLSGSTDKTLMWCVQHTLRFHNAFHGQVGWKTLVHSGFVPFVSRLLTAVQ
jgi:hypothetical protein